MTARDDIPSVSVILPTRNPHPGRLRRTLAALATQTLKADRWETLLIDNASDAALEVPVELVAKLPGFRCLREKKVGLTSARLCGIRAARSDALVFVDDDNQLAPDYLAVSLRIFSENSRLAAAGGRIAPEWETTPPAWTREFHSLLALRDLGSRPTIAAGGKDAPWPHFAPVGAGLVIRRAAALAYAEALDADPRRRALDRTGGSLASGGDNDLVFTALHGGGDIGYFPELSLTHLIPAGRLDPAYLARLNRGIMRSWVCVLALHGQCPWPAIAPWTLSLRLVRARLRTRPWHGPVARIRAAGLCGQLEGQADRTRLSLY
jgi:glycosyltransferase involved in cell wall biosynthesis